MVLDNFNRANGSLGSNWAGATGGYSIVNNQMDVGSGNDVYWTTVFGANQEAYVTLTNIDLAASEIDLLLKAQSNTYWGNGVLEVFYLPASSVVQVWTFTTQQNWVQRGADIPIAFANGDRFGARVTATGQVQVYRNGVLLATRDASAWTYATSGGYIGVWILNGPNSVLDDFGGGTVP